MRKLVWIMLLAMALCAVAVLATVEQSVTRPVSCTDSDGGSDDTHLEKYINVLGETKYGISVDHTDECVSNKEGYHLDPSVWVREYYCGGSPVQMQHKDFDCTAYGYKGCAGGKCTGGSGTSTTTTPTHTTKPEPTCGNHHVDASEQCDPPDKICYDGGDVGVCSKDCQCKLYKPGGGSSTETTTVTTTTTRTTQPAPAPETQPEVEQTPPPAPEEQPPAAEPERQPLPTEEMPSGKGIGVTRAITNGVKHFFSWIASWF